MEIKRLLAQRNKDKKGKPPFVVRASNYQKRIKKRWRLPRGVHSAIRQVHRGRPAMPTPGYGSPKAVRGLSRDGIRVVVVRTKKELLAVDGKSEGAVLSAKLGGRSRVLLLRLAAEKKIPVLNVKNPQKRAEEIEAEVKKRSAEAAVKKKVKEAAKTEQQKLKESKDKADTNKEQAGSQGENQEPKASNAAEGKVEKQKVEKEKGDGGSGQDKGKEGGRA